MPNKVGVNKIDPIDIEYLIDLTTNKKGLFLKKNIGMLVLIRDFKKTKNLVF